LFQHAPGLSPAAGTSLEAIAMFVPSSAPAWPLSTAPAGPCFHASSHGRQATSCTLCSAPQALA